MKTLQVAVAPFAMHILYFLITLFLVETVNSFQNDPGDELGLNLNTDQQSIDFWDSGANLAPPVVLGNPAVDQSDMSERISPETSLPPLGVATDSGAPDIYTENSLANTITGQFDSSILDQDYEVAADEGCSSGDFREKLEDPELIPVEKKPVQKKPVRKKPVRKKPVEKKPVKPIKTPWRPESEREERGRLGVTKRPERGECFWNPSIKAGIGDEANCRSSQNTYCSGEQYERPYLKKCIVCM